MGAWKRAFGAVVVGVLLVGLPLASSAGGRHGRGHGHGHGHHHGGGTRVVIGVGPSFWWGAPYGYWWGPRPYYYAPAPYYVYAPRPVVVEPPVYVERDPAPEPTASAYWYYCESEAAYYPDVATCPEPWLPVPPRSE